MVIIGNKSAQLGNRLVVFAHFLANAMEYRYRLWNPAFREYAAYFQSTCQDLMPGHPPRRTCLGLLNPAPDALFNLVTRLSWFCTSRRVANSLVHVLNIQGAGDAVGRNYDLGSDEFRLLRERTRFLIVQGWLFRDPVNLARHADRIRKFFAPIPLHAQNVDALIGRARADCDVLVGLHIRQGDYKTWLGGRHYHDTATYVRLARSLVALWPGKRVKFLVCSNGPQDAALFPFAMGSGHLVEDMYSFAQCDFLLGPPSTYTAWASFYGSVPLYVIERPVAPVSLDSFKVSAG